MHHFIQKSLVGSHASPLILQVQLWTGASLKPSSLSDPGQYSLPKKGYYGKEQQSEQRTEEFVEFPILSSIILIADQQIMNH